MDRDTAGKRTEVKAAWVPPLMTRQGQRCESGSPALFVRRIFQAEGALGPKALSRRHAWMARETTEAGVTRRKRAWGGSASGRQPGRGRTWTRC